MSANTIHSVLNRPLVFVHGKGGVGKSVVSQAIAIAQSNRGAKTLWVTIEDPLESSGAVQQISPSLWKLNCDFTQAFEEYAELKIGSGPITRLFLQNKLIRYLAKAAPGIHELVLLGKIWYERLHFTHVIVDLPSTGYGLAMFQSTANFTQLFHGGPLHRDAEGMQETFRNPAATGHVILALPEETPLQEALELNHHLSQIFPKNPAAFLVNRVFPGEIVHTPHPSASPWASSMNDYIAQRIWLEDFNLRIWRAHKISFEKLDFIPPPVVEAPRFIAEKLSNLLLNRAYL